MFSFEGACPAKSFFLTREILFAIIPMLLKAAWLLTYKMVKSHRKEVRVDCHEGPPVPIPNTEVKLMYADNTWRVTAREDR